MKKFRVIWRISLEMEVEAENEDDAQDVVCNLDCQYDGEYVPESFDIVKVEEVEDREKLHAELIERQIDMAIEEKHEGG